METGVDNQINNASNNYDLFDVFQKRGTIDHFNDEADFKPNGTEAKTDLFLFDRPTNGKRPASEFEDDLGPETNIDSLDELSPIEKESHKMADFDIKMAEDIPDNIAHTITDNIMETITENDEKSITGNNNSKKLDEDLDLEVQGHQINELEPVKDVREETPTPPADSVLDSSGVADNVAESEDSEDEWNYYRVDPKQKENSSPPVETDNKVSDPSDEMSQLNPDAKEFVPVSPTRVASSPVPYPRDLIDDPLIAQSPRRALPMDINLPSPVEFQCEVKQRPSELFDEFEDKTDEQNGHQLSSQEIMQNLLNGKDVSEIEFHPHNISKSSGDNIFEGEIENQNLIEISKENLSPSDKTESSLSPEEQNFANFPAKTQDPMSMSFYQDKDEEKDSFSTNPFDLNKVQVLPENIDDFIEKTDVVSPVESPLGIPLAKTPEIGDKIGSPVPNLDNSKSLIEIANSPICDVAKSPEISENVAKSPEITELSEDLICAFAKSPEIAKSSEDLICAVAKSPEIAKSPDDLICAVAKSPEIAKSPEDLICAVAKSPEIAKSSEDLICAVAKSPEICEEQKVPEISQTLFCDFTTEPIIHPIPDVTNSPENSPMGPLSPKSPIPELTGLVSPDITASIKDENVSEEISDIKTPENLEKIATPEVSKVEELISEAIQDIPDQISDFCEISGTIAPISGTPEPILEKKVDLVSDIEIKANFEQILAPNDELGQNLSGTSSEAVNAFLERSHVPEVTSPLSPSEEIEKFQTEPPENWKIEIKTEVIQPEFPITTIASPCEENKEEIPPPTPKKIEEPVEKKSAKITSKPLPAKKSPASPASKLGDQKTDKKTPRAPITKTRTPISSPRVPPLKTTPTQPAKKLTNGDVKSTVKTTNLVKKTTTTVTKSAVEKTEKKNPIKPPSAVSATSRPATATRTVGSTASRAPASRPMSATAPKAKPGTLPAKTTTSSATTKPPPIRQPVAGATRSAPTTLKPRLPSTSTVPKPRPPSTTSTRTVTKQPDTEKQQKDTVNKQLSKTTSRTTAVTKSSTLPPKRTDLKTSVSSRIQTTRTTTTTLKSTTKKPDITKTAITKTKTSSTKPAAEQNGVNIVQEIKTTIEEPQLIKDNSPVEIDNSKIQEVIAD